MGGVQLPGRGAQPWAPWWLDAPGLSPRVKCVSGQAVLWPSEWCLSLAPTSRSVPIARIGFAHSSECLSCVQSGIIGGSAGGSGVWPASLGATEACNLTALGSYGCHKKRPQTWWLKRAEIDSFTVLEAEAVLLPKAVGDRLSWPLLMSGGSSSAFTCPSLSLTSPSPVSYEDTCH